MAPIVTVGVSMLKLPALAGTNVPVGSTVWTVNDIVPSTASGP